MKPSGALVAYSVINAEIDESQVDCDVPFREETTRKIESSIAIAATETHLLKMIEQDVAR